MDKIVDKVGIMWMDDVEYIQFDSLGEDPFKSYHIYYQHIQFKIYVPGMFLILLNLSVDYTHEEKP